jgi:hypothetical protein
MKFPLTESGVDHIRQDEIDRLKEHVKRNLNGRLYGFQLTIHNDGLILRGRAMTYYAKQLAQHAIMATSVRIANDIEVS